MFRIFTPFLPVHLGGLRSVPRSETHHFLQTLTPTGGGVSATSAQLWAAVKSPITFYEL